MLNKNFEITSFMPPALTTLGGITYACPGWHKVPEGTTLKEVFERWTKYVPKSEEKPTHTISEMVDSSTAGKQYNVTFDGTYWNCGCAGFQFRKNCRHVKEIKAKNNIKELI